VADHRERKTAANGNELLGCDIVMAGGVTSGIIYPGAVAMIARRFFFQSIGGTSVGAIAAAVTAAAEYGRRTGNLTAFRQIEALPSSLGHVASDGHSRLFHLFTPDLTTKPLLAFVTPLVGGGGVLRKIAGVLTATLSIYPIALPAALAVLAGVTHHCHAPSQRSVRPRCDLLSCNNLLIVCHLANDARPCITTALASSLAQERVRHLYGQSAA
jgi:hypothetical protein